MIARIAKQFTFDAAHFLPGLPDDHPCSRMHGHTYGVELQLVGPVDERGFVLDYADIHKAWKHVHELSRTTCAITTRVCALKAGLRLAGARRP